MKKSTYFLLLTFWITLMVAGCSKEKSNVDGDVVTKEEVQTIANEVEDSNTNKGTNEKANEKTNEKANEIVNEIERKEEDMQMNDFKLGKTKKEEPYYTAMLERSLITTGNNYRVKKVIEKAQNGEEVTIAYIGGSITEGASATTNEETYAYLSYQYFKDTFGKGDGENINFVNAGMGGTPSTLGMIRYDRDVLKRAVSKPDIVFVEFAVNDYDDPTNGEAYESLVLDILQQDNAPAVVLLFSVFQTRWNLEDRLSPVGQYYNLPMISIKNAVVSELDTVGGNLTDEEYFADQYHPTNLGHQIMSDCISYYYDTVNQQTKEEKNIIISTTPKLGDSFVGIQMIDSTTSVKDISIALGGFSEVDSALCTLMYDSAMKTFPNNWMHTKSSGTENFSMTLDCKNLLLVYKQSSSSNAGKADIYIDGEKTATIDSYTSSGWNNPYTAIVLNDKESTEHTFEVKMAEGDEEKEFSILAFGYTR